jgi:hypothetical protein
MHLLPLLAFVACSRVNCSFTCTARKRNLVYVHPYSGHTTAVFSWLLIFLIEVTTNAELITRTCSNRTLWENYNGFLQSETLKKRWNLQAYWSTRPVITILNFQVCSWVLPKTVREPKVIHLLQVLGIVNNLISVNPDWSYIQRYFFYRFFTISTFWVLTQCVKTNCKFQRWNWYV